MQSIFTIYNASAGSGKTYTIVKEYLKIVLSSSSPYKYQNILAITFTNKAAGEMKERIFNQLNEFSKIKEGSDIPQLLLDIENDLKIDRNILIERSKSVASRILHDYSKFSISTIDKFTHRLIRTFSHDLDLPMNFDVEMNTDNILKEAIDVLVSKIGIEEELTKTIIAFSIDNFRDGNSWDISYGLQKSSKEIFKEESYESLKKLKSYSLNDFNNITNKLKKELKTSNDIIREIGEGAMQLIDSIGVDYNVFSRSGVPKYFKACKDVSKIEAKSTLDKQFFEDERLYAKTKSGSYEANQIDTIFEELRSYYEQSKLWLEEHSAYVAIGSLLLTSIKSISLLNEIESEIENIKQHNNVLFSAEFNKKIAEEIKDQPIPYIYERIGDKYDYFFIDEFQDTSVLQWQNLLPLIDNSLASGGNCFIVGDGKQAIYRWRGGKAEQFIDLYRKNVDLGVEINALTLPRNYRSFKHIVDFSNEMFSFNSKLFDNEDYSGMYLEGSTQESNTNNEGYIEIEFLGKESKSEMDELYCSKTFSRIKKLVSEGYNLKDIAILTRSNRHGVVLSNYLLKNGIDVISKESLLLKNNEAVDFCVQILQLVNSKNDYESRLKVLNFLIEKGLVNISEVNKHDLYMEMLSLESNKFFKKLNSFNLEFDLDEFLKLPLYDAVEYLIRKFSLNIENKLELQYFLDFILEYSSKNNLGIDSFLETWEDKKDRLSLVLADGIDAVQIMSIHKSKGLEFPIVLLPYADWDLTMRDEKKWINVSRLNYEFELEEALISVSSKLKNIPLGEDIYKESADENLLDNLNMMYVAVTRAVQRLYVIAKEENKNASSFFSQFINSNSEYLQDNLVVEEGVSKIGKEVFVKTKLDNENINEIILKEFDSKNWKDRVSLSFEAPKFWEIDKISDSEYGNLVHNTLSLVEYIEDIDEVVDRLETEGSLNSKLKATLKTIVNSICNHSELRDYYTSKYTVRNEADIIVDGKVLRPDRVSIYENTAIIIDYKTGTPKEEHEMQINDYAVAISSLGYKVEKKLLVYVDDENIKVLSV